MKSINRVFLVGRLGMNPEMRITKNGKSYVKLSVATNRKWKREDGTQEYKTDWHKVTVWGPQAESCAENLSTGSPVFIEGHLSRFETQDEKGSTRYQTAITAQEISFLTMPLRGLEQDQATAS